MIPAQDSSDVVGMYDTVNNVFYTNAGSGTFSPGPEVSTIVERDSLKKVMFDSSLNQVNCYKSVMFHRDSDESPLIMVETLKQSMFFD